MIHAAISITEKSEGKKIIARQPVKKQRPVKLKEVPYSMKLSYSIALLLPPVLSNLDTSRSSTVGETEYPRLRRASRSSDESILPLRSRSNLSNIAWTIERNISTSAKHDWFACLKVREKGIFSCRSSYSPILNTVKHRSKFLGPWKVENKR